MPSLALRRSAFLLPHEVAFGGFLALTTVRLGAATSPLDPRTLTCLAFLLGGAALAMWTAERADGPRWRMRLGYYAIMMNILFVQLKTIVPPIHPGRADALLQHWDDRLFGGDPSLALQGIANPVLTEIMAICYCSFFLYLYVALVRRLFGPLDQAKAFYAGLFSLYAIGFLGYTMFPASGPYLALADRYSAPLHGSVVTAILLGVYPLGTNGADVFPSLHCAVSAFILGFDWLYDRRRFWRWLAPIAGLWLSTLYLRFHYGVDILAGFALAGAALLLALRFHRSRLKVL